MFSLALYYSWYGKPNTVQCKTNSDIMKKYISVPKIRKVQLRVQYLYSDLFSACEIAVGQKTHKNHLK